MTLTYIPDGTFNDVVSNVVSSLGTNGIMADGERIDLVVTEALLVGGIWPNSWTSLMTDVEKAKLVNRIVDDRKACIRIPAGSRPFAI